MNKGWSAWNNQPLRNTCYKIGSIVFLNLSLNLKEPRANDWWIITQMPEGFRPTTNIMNVGYIYCNGLKITIETHIHVNGYVDILGSGQSYNNIDSYGASFVYLSK